MTTIVLGQFESGEALLGAARTMRESGHSGLDVYSPFPLAGSSEALGLPRSSVPLVVLIAGLSGAGIGYTMQLFCNAIDFPINVGNRPPHAAPSFVPITFELGVLFASFGALFALLWLCGFPKLFHPVSRSDAFRSATVDGFWLSVELDPARWDAKTVSHELEKLGAKAVSLVEEEP